MVDGQRSIIFLKPIPPTSAGKEFELRSKVLGVYDKGKAGTVIETETVLAERGGDVYTKAVGSAFFVGQGNWGGPKGENQQRGCHTQVNEETRPKHSEFPTSAREETRRSACYTDHQGICPSLQVRC